MLCFLFFDKFCVACFAFFVSKKVDVSKELLGLSCKAGNVRYGGTSKTQN